MIIYFYRRIYLFLNKLLKLKNTFKRKKTIILYQFIKNLASLRYQRHECNVRQKPNQNVKDKIIFQNYNCYQALGTWTTVVTPNTCIKFRLYYSLAKYIAQTTSPQCSNKMFGKFKKYIIKGLVLKWRLIFGWKIKKTEPTNFLSEKSAY